MCDSEQSCSSEVSLPGLQVCQLWATRIGKITLEGEGMVSGGTRTESEVRVSRS